MKKGIKNVDAIVRKLESTLTRATNNKLLIVREKKRGKKEVKKKRKIEAIATKQYRARVGISLSNKTKDKSDTRNDIDYDQAKDI